MKRTLETAMMAVAVVGVIALAGACGTMTSPSPVSPSSTTSATSPTSSATVHVDGKISSINANARSFVVAATTVVVPAGTALTSSAGQVEFKDLQVEMEIHVVGTQQGDVVSAQAVQVDDHGGQPSSPTPGAGEAEPEPQPEPEPEPAETEVEFRGAVAGPVSGACPQLTLSIMGRTVKSTSATEFKDVACADVKGGLMLEVKGMAAPNGTVTATRLKLDK